MSDNQEDHDNFDSSSPLPLPSRESEHVGTVNGEKDSKSQPVSPLSPQLSSSPVTNSDHESVTRVATPSSGSFAKTTLDAINLNDDVDGADDDADGDEDYSPETGKKGKVKKARWTKEMDLALINSWLNVNKDPIVGTDKSGASYWQRIANNFNAATGQSKTSKQCKDHWAKNIPYVNHFNVCFKRSIAVTRNGWSDDDYLKEALQMYASEKKKPFTRMLWWLALKNTDKYINVSTESEHVLKKSRLNMCGDYTTSSDLYSAGDHPCKECPIGQKAVRRDKGKATSSENYEFQNQMIQCEMEKVEALKSIAATKKEKVAEQRMTNYVELMKVDTSSMDDEEKIAHKNILEMLRKKLFG